jgi:hypothetical protein
MKIKYLYLIDSLASFIAGFSIIFLVPQINFLSLHLFSLLAGAFLFLSGYSFRLFLLDKGDEE